MLLTCQAHSAITVTFTDVTKGEAAKALVRRRIEISYNTPASDEEIMALFDKEKFSFNPAGTQAPLRENASSRSGVENYLDRRSIYARALRPAHRRCPSRGSRGSHASARPALRQSWQRL